MRERFFLVRNSILLFFILLGFTAQANHLVGGSVTYKYIGTVGGKERYQITFSMYRDCRAGNPQFDQSIDVTFYENTSSKQAQLTQTFFLTSSNSVSSPAGAANCTGAPSVCLEQAIYRDYVDLPPSSYGYIFEYMRCCRTSTMVNIQKDMGQTYLGIIPPTSYKNNAPYFSDVPAPYICANDTVSLLYTASESDGDSLSYALVWPWSGGSASNPIPSPSSFFSTPAFVSYNSGYSFSLPFGSSGFASIDQTTGLLKLFSSHQGDYVLAVDVYEYRKGVLISTTRRDIQIIVTNCPANPSPSHTGYGTGSQTSYYINAGEKLSFDIDYTDPTDSITLTYSGDVFDSTGAGPKAVMTGDSNGIFKGFKKVHSTFKWQSGCLQGRGQPYVFYVKIRDNGCPPKTSYQTFSIYVKPFLGADKITGPQTVCPGVVEQYSVNKTASSSIVSWIVKGGRILPDKSDNPVSVIWNNVGKGTLQAVETSGYGCKADTVTLGIKILPRPKRAVISGQARPCKNKSYDYSVDNHNFSRYYWHAKNGILSGDTSSSKVSVHWTSLDSTYLSVVERDSAGCYGDTITLAVKVATVSASKIFGSPSVCPFARNVEYWADSTSPTSRYSWYMDGGLQSAGAQTSHIKVNWGAQGAGSVKLVELTQAGCVGDTLYFGVKKDYTLFTSDISGDSSLCAYTNNVSYSVQNTNGSTYTWQIKGGAIIAGNGTSNIIVDWDGADTAVLKVIETAYDSVSQRSCIGQPVLKLVYIHPVPATTAIAGPKDMCENDTATYAVTGLPGSIYRWWLNGKVMTAETGNNITHVFDIASSVRDTVSINVQETSQDGCIGPMRGIAVKIHRMPVTSGISGPNIVCLPDLNSASYSVRGAGTSTYSWVADGGTLASGNGTSNVKVNWGAGGTRTLSVTETNDLGCKGEPKTMQVQVDSLQMNITLVTTAPTNDKVIDVYWERKNSQFLDRYIHIYREDNNSGGYHLIDSVAPTETHYTDSKVETGKYSYRYKLEVPNTCGSMVSSNTHRSILLQDKLVNDSTLQPGWNAYEGWPVQDYALSRSYDNDTTVTVYSTSMLFSDMVTNLQAFRECYRVAALSGSGTVSWSNRLCTDLQAMLFMPNAFTPNADDLNEKFRVIATHYREYHISIYNRWGECVFTSSSADKMWDGTYKGAPCADGLYMYKAEVTGVNNHVYRTGTLQLIR